MPVKLISACKELHVGMTTLVDFCKNHGISIQSDPNYRIPDDVYQRIERLYNQHVEEVEETTPTTTDQPKLSNTNKPIINSGIVYNPFEEQRRKDKLAYAREHPEASIENRIYSFWHSDPTGVLQEIQRVCERKFLSSTRKVVCTVDTKGEENAGENATITYGFLHYQLFTVPFVCVAEVFLEKTQITIAAFKKVDDTTDYDFDALLDEFFTKYTDFQRLYQSKAKGQASNIFQL